MSSLLGCKVTIKAGDLVVTRMDLMRVGNRLVGLVTLIDADAARFFFLARSADSQMEFDLELAKRQSAETRQGPSSSPNENSRDSTTPSRARKPSASTSSDHSAVK